MSADAPFTFVKCRYWYDSFLDFWRMVEVNDFPWCYVDQIDVGTETTYLIPTINGEFRPHIDNHRNERKNCSLVWWNLERQDHADLGDLDNYLDAVWVSCHTYYEILKPNGKTLFVPMGSDARIGTNADDLPKRYDFIHLSYLTHRRSCVIDHLPLSQPDRGQDLWDDEEIQQRRDDNAWTGSVLDTNGARRPESCGRRHEALCSSRFMLSIRQDELPMQEPIRIAIAAAYALPFVSEHVPDPWPLVPRTHYFDLPYAEITTQFPQIARYTDSREIGYNLWELYTQKMPFAKNVQQGWERLKAAQAEGRCRLQW